ncbi:hypothetical protein ACWT_5633 [Actinoplanes sp. SE50]|uniref:DNA/RNA helicase domain-containing protein n=1 Tax=unclassified Actinoplanes TaxID=2626549 RepID=UPI00023ED0FD|nr:MULTISPECIES: DNA/RNA helicase domain-containing protein [unclassified Actinoplanes]AEV86650.1 uncharacterized protein ACPL_5763 [Actinoplanes sp. SE50/110]ATO85048.1 hypothetical protein ACWT_5633 [Actinoplanes sp. SE50]SLM02458.1 hypothetical protein ACSP50_5708 [Actinoplanes sp. SE50/110]
MTAGGAWAPLEVYRTADDLVRRRNKLIKEVEDCYKRAHPNGSGPSRSEVQSWRESLYEVATTLVDSGLGQVWMFIEYRVAPDMNPIDVVLAGSHPVDGLSYAALELKQWGSVERPTLSHPAGLCASCKAAGNTALCERCAVECVYAPFYSKHKKHPAIQVRDNLIALKKYHSMFDDRYVNLVGAAYLHNLKDEQHQWISNVAPCGDIPTFTARQPDSLREFLTRNFGSGAGTRAAQSLLERRRTNLPITSELGAVVDGHTRFSLIENQLHAVTSVMDSLRATTSSGAKKVFVVSGRAGTGKSLIALTLLGKAIENQYKVRYVSGGIASRETFKRASIGHRPAFTTLNNVADNIGVNEQDLILCDEAHRLTRQPMRGSYSVRPGETSVAVVVTRAKVPVFFIDGDQRLFADEVWSPEALKREIQRLGAEVVPIALDRPLRAVGSATYDTWIQRLLTGDPVPWNADADSDPEPFELYYATSAARMESFLHSKEASGASARISAGMCWNWTDDTGTFPDVAPDAGWARPWNAGDNHKTPGVPKRRFWATEPGGFGQIGCVHTAQGLEYEWGGVIMGPDLTTDGRRWRVHREHVLSKANRIGDDEELLRAICNAYGVLMTRSIRGTVLYSVDPATRQLFADLGLSRI